MRIRAGKNLAGKIIAKCLSVLLAASVCLLNTGISFADFVSIEKKGFSASVTIGGGGGGGAYPEKPDFYKLSLPYVKYFLDRALDNTPQTDYAFNGFTRSYYKYLGGGDAYCENVIASGASSYDHAILGRISLFNGKTTILDTYIDYFYQLLDKSNPLLKCSDGYTDQSGNQILYGPYKIVRILNRDSANWWDSWDWSVDTGTAAVLVMYAAEAYDKTQNTAYKDFAILLAEYMLKLKDTDGGLRYGPIGMYHETGTEYFWNLKSTEQNERALYAFEALYRMTGSSLYQDAANGIKAWLKGMYDFDVHLFSSAASYKNNAWEKSDFGYVATDVMALAPFNMMFDDAYFGATQGQRDYEVDQMFTAIETRTAFVDSANKPIFFRFSISQTGNYGSVEISSQMAIAYLKIAQIYHDRGNDTKAAIYLDKYNTLISSLETFFKVPDDDSLSKIAPYASYLDKSVAGNVPTGTGFDTYNCEAALAASYFAFAKTGYMPYVYDGGSGIPNIGPAPVPSADSDYDGIPDTSDPNPYDPYDAYEIGNDGFTNLEKYTLEASGVNIFDDTIGLSLSAAPVSGTAPIDITFTASHTSTDVVKYEWDFDGNGTYDRWQYASKGNSVKYKFTASGTYNVRARATSSLGRVDTAVISVNITKPASAPSAEVSGSLLPYPVANELIIPVLKKLEGKGTASGSNEIVSYKWDIAGNGEYDIVSTKSADATKTFNETISRIFTGSLKVTDSKGLSDAVPVIIMANATSWDDSPYRPMVFLNNSIIYGTPGADVSLGGFGSPAAGNSYGYAKKLEWDFEGYGTYDWSSTLENDNWTGFADVTYKYGAPGVYKATLRAQTEANVASYKSATVIIQGSEPAVRANARVSKDGAGFTPDISYASVPINAIFDHSQSTGAVRYEWDFDGDKRIDYVTADVNVRPSYNYTIPGYYTAMLKVIDSSNRIDTAYVTVFCCYPDSYASSIKMPKDNQSISGNSVTLSADVFPDNSGVSSVMFQLSADAVTWSNIGEGSVAMPYSVIWDTTGIANGTYKVRAIVNNVSSDDFKPITLLVDNSGVSTDVYENNNGLYVKKEILDPAQSNTVTFPDGTSIDIPYGALPNDEPAPVITASEVNVSGANNTIDISIIGSGQFLKDITIRISYPDADNNGIVDGTNIDENTIVLKWYDEATGTWEILYDSIVYPDENYVIAKVNHLTIFGWGFLGGGAAAIAGRGGSSSGDSTASYCFIATAAYGTPMSEDVIALRNFRDVCLLKNNFGRRFVDNYYRYSPPAARFISTKPLLRRITRFLLKPLVKLAKILTS
jgi:hypothetical protein